MKIELVDRFAPVAPELPYTTFCYVERHTDDSDMLFVGSQGGEIASFDIARRLTRHNLRSDNISKGGGHSGTVTCLVFTQNPKLCHQSKAGLLISGSSDRTIKVWSPFSLKPLIQTLVGHNGSIAAVADGKDGTLVSCAVDGSLKIWTLQRGRTLMLHPFFECTFSLVGNKNTNGASWLNAMTVNNVGVWSCYLGDMNGSIEVYKKGSELNDVDPYVAPFTGQLTKYTRWEHVHRLGISQLSVVADDNYLVSLSYDCSCKVLDGSQGQTIFVIDNARRCMYTGVFWSASSMSFTLVDELGTMEVFGALAEKIRDTAAIVTPNARQQKNIMKSHKNPMLSIVEAYKESSHFLSLIPEQGVIILWKAVVDDNCIEYIGHSSCIVNMAVLPGFVYTPTPPVNYHDDTSSGGSSGVISRRNSDDFLSKLNSNHNQAFNSMNSTLALLTDGLTGNASKIAGEGINKSSNEVGLLKSSTSSARICKEEKMFFSCGADGVIRCWDEFLKGEQYQFKYTATNMNANGNTKAGNMNSNNTIVSNYSNVTKSTKTGKSTKKSITFSKDTVRLPATVKSNAESQKPSRKNSYHGQITSHHIEITCMLMMWEYNAIVTGSEDGIVCVWDADLGSKIMSKALTCAVTAVITAKTKRCDVLVAADISGAMAMWNLTLFKRNRTNLVVDSVTENSFHSPEEPGILCLAFHHQMKVMFSGGQDGTIRYWRLAHDSEANTLLRPHESDPPHSAIYHHRERRHRQMKAKYGENYATGLEEMSSTVSCPSGLLTNTESVQNYRQERNSFVTVEPINSLVCTDDFLLSGDGSGEIVLWFVIPIEHSEDIHGGMLSPHSHKTTTTGHGSLGENALPILNPEDAVNDYLNRKFNQDAFQNIGVENSSVAPFMMIIPMCRWFGNVQNPMKSILTMEQVSDHEVYVGQAGCGRIPNKLEVWKVGMKNAATVNRAKNEAAQARKKAQTKEVAFHLDASIKTTSIESVPTAATTSRTSADTDRRSSKTQELVIDARIGTADIGKFVGVDDDMVDAPSTTDVKGPSNLEESSTSCDPTPAAHLAPEPEVERKKVKLLHEEYEVLLVPASEDEVAIEEEECSTVINEDQYAFDQRPISPPAHVDAMLNMAKHQKQLHNKIKMLEVTELRTVFTYNFSPNTNPNCLQLMLTDAVDVTPARETKINRITRTSLKRGEIIVPQYVYVGLVEGHIYKLIV